jgi:hypothetical protein
VQKVKHTPGYDAGTMGTTLRLEAGATTFDPNNFTSGISDLSSPAPKQLRFKFPKAYGKIDGVNLYGRKTGSTTEISLGRFNASPANVVVPLTEGSPEEWQFQTRAVRRDQEIGHPSPVMTAIIRS